MAETSGGNAVVNDAAGGMGRAITKAPTKAVDNGQTR
jgi:hypothetical protein